MKAILCKQHGPPESLVVEELPSGPATQKPRVTSIWPSVHPRLVELIKAHRSTMLFVNSRRLAERLAGALNELAGAEIALAHHGSISIDSQPDQGTTVQVRLPLAPA